MVICDYSSPQIQDFLGQQLIYFFCTRDAIHKMSKRMLIIIHFKRMRHLCLHILWYFVLLLLPAMGAMMVRSKAISQGWSFHLGDRWCRERCRERCSRRHEAMFRHLGVQGATQYSTILIPINIITLDERCVSHLMASNQSLKSRSSQWHTKIKPKCLVTPLVRPCHMLKLWFRLSHISNGSL